MKVNGFKLQQEIREAQEERNLLHSRFTPNLHAFPGEEKEDVLEIADAIECFEEQIAKLQMAQGRYNQQVIVDVNGRKMPLGLAVKMLGGVTRVMTLWRRASSEPVRWHGDGLTRDADEVVAQKTVSLEEIDRYRKQSRARASALRAAIQKGNATEVDSTEIGYEAS